MGIRVAFEEPNYAKRSMIVIITLCEGGLTTKLTCH